MTTDTIIYKGQLRGHNGWVTSLATSAADPNLLVSGGRDNNLIVWDLTRDQSNFGVPRRSLQGHSHFVSDVVLSSDGQFALSSSWDKTLRLWDLNTGNATRIFQDHTHDVTSVAFSPDNRQIVSSSRDRTIKLWNTLGECKYTLSTAEQGHTNWVSCVRFSPSAQIPIIVSGGWDKVVKVWDMQTCKLTTNLIGHTGVINAVTISPDGSLCASGGKDGIAMLWDLTKGEHLYSLDPINTSINALAFSPNRYWLCAATDSGIRIWNLETKQTIAELKSEILQGSKNTRPSCISLAWSADGSTLFSGFTDGSIKVWGV